ncbi:MAG: flagellar motor protein MotB, partial [Aestuariivirgaceae bacterium]
MAEDGSDEKLQPIIIVKRGGGDHDDHHGGVWKIAFADFMTAMMAFFLVMWLINASNDETRSQVASYFNPVKLTDAVTAPKGVRHSDPVTNIPEKAEDAGQGGQPGQGGKTGEGEADDATEAAEAESADNPDSEVPEAALFKDPYAVLVEIAGEAQQINIDEGNGKPSDGHSGLAGGEAFRDPFDPAFWQEPDEPEAQADKPETAMMSEAAT